VTDELRFERQFWIQYWSVGFASVQFLHHFISNIPTLQQMGRYEYPQLRVLLHEIKFLYFVWIFAMETLLARYQRYLGVDERKENWKKYVPLTFLTKAIGPKLLRVQLAISEQISKETWQRLIRSKAQRVLELMVMLQFMESETMDYLLQLLEEGRSLLFLSVFMVMPAPICQMGMLYPQLIFPSARSLVARGDAVETLSLKFWVINSILSLFLSLSWWLWWCIPFSNQLLLAMRCFATFPSTITHYYYMVELELITFGILSGEPQLAVKETKTIQALRAVVKRLPRDKHAQSFQFEIDEHKSEFKVSDDDSSIGSEDTTESEEERRRQRRREKRAKKKLLKQKKLSESMNSNGERPPPLLSESFGAQFSQDEDNDLYAQQKKEERDAKNSERVLYPSISMTGTSSHTASSSTRNRLLNSSNSVGSSYSSSQMQTDLRLMNLKIATPTESIAGEVEVQVQPRTLRSKSTNKGKRPVPSMFPATHPKSSEIDLAMPTASDEEEIVFQPSNDSDTNSGMDLSDIDTACSSAIEANESYETWSPLYDQSNTDETKTMDTETTTKNSFLDTDEVQTPPRRSTRLIELREWQERKRQEEEAKLGSKKKGSKSSRTKKSTSTPHDKGEKKSKSKSPKKTRKKPKPERTPIANKPTAASIGKRVKKKSSAASPEKTKKSKKDKGEAPLQDNIEGEDGRSSSSSPQKTKPRKIPNSRKKKEKEKSSVFGGFF